ncbi:endonuclease domain-containing protein [Rhizorhapis sp. SPR117]|uniref:endonuclease domain-containing protein n=1 Tax=Rhizorhapis sp. SPR117 TaxID=2912611 RepID=UPI001F345032|nr:endonuclease domain-containing protein [Rhizorhapis sp. SPR117]
MRLEPTLKERAKQMRANPTRPELNLWLELRANRFENQQFTRQTIIAPYIVDFASKAVKLIIEVDGDTHSDKTRYDADRTKFLESLGYRMIRFTNHEVLMNMEGVLTAIAEALNASPLSPTLPPRGEGETP